MGETTSVNVDSYEAIGDNVTDAVRALVNDTLEEEDSEGDIEGDADIDRTAE